MYATNFGICHLLIQVSPLTTGIGSISMTDQSDDEFDHDNLVESKVGISGLFEPHCIIRNATPLFAIFSSYLLILTGPMRTLDF